jgi:hypothetical protein
LSVISAAGPQSTCCSTTSVAYPRTEANSEIGQRSFVRSNPKLARTIAVLRYLSLARAHRDNRLFVQLGKAIAAWRPRCPVFRKDVTLRADFRVVIEKTSWNPGP